MGWLVKIFNQTILRQECSMVGVLLVIVGISDFVTFLLILKILHTTQLLQNIQSSEVKKHNYIYAQKCDLLLIFDFFLEGC